MIDRPQPRIRDDKHRQMQPRNDILQIVHRLLIVADRTHNAAGPFHRHIRIRLRHPLPRRKDHILLQRMPLETRRQMRRHRMLVQIRQEHILRFMDPCELIHKARIRCSDRPRPTDRRLVVARIIPILTHRLHQKRRHIGLPDIRIRPRDKKSLAHCYAFLHIKRDGSIPSPFTMYPNAIHHPVRKKMSCAASDESHAACAAPFPCASPSHGVRKCRKHPSAISRSPSSAAMPASQPECTDRYPPAPPARSSTAPPARPRSASPDRNY